MRGFTQGLGFLYRVTVRSKEGIMGPDNQRDRDGEEMLYSEPKTWLWAQGRGLYCQDHRLSGMLGWVMETAAGYSRSCQPSEQTPDLR